MRNDHKKQHPRKEQNRHQAKNVSHNKATQQQTREGGGRTTRQQPRESKEIKGMDIDLMNYTDI